MSIDDLERKIERGQRSRAALSAADEVIGEREESRLQALLSKHDGGNCTHDEYVRYTEAISTLRRLRRDLEQNACAGDEAADQMRSEDD